MDRYLLFHTPLDESRLSPQGINEGKTTIPIYQTQSMFSVKYFCNFSSKSHLIKGSGENLWILESVMDSFSLSLQ